MMLSSLLLLLALASGVSAQCPSGWTPYPADSLCYRYFFIPQIYSGARLRCQSQGSGSTLATPKNAGQNEIVDRVSWGLRHSWIGLNDTATEGAWVYEDGTPLGAYVNWAPSNPSTLFGGFLDCVAQQRGGAWDDRNCIERRSYICQQSFATTATTAPTTPTAAPTTPTAAPTTPTAAPTTPTAAPTIPTATAITARPCTCPTGFQVFQEAKLCYRDGSSSQAQTYASAKRICSLLGSTLPMPKSAPETTFLRTLTTFLRSTSSTDLWLGLTDIVTEGTYVYEDGTALGAYAPWAPGNPPTDDSSAFRDCTVLIKDKGTWSLESCGLTYRSVVCQQAATCPDDPTPAPVTTVTAASTVAPTVCPAGWLINNGVCYVLSVNTATYSNARLECLAAGAQLVQPQTAAVNSVVRALVEALAGEIFGANIWIGLTDAVREGTFVWDDGQALAATGYANWATGEPLDAFGLGIWDCGILSSQSGQWAAKTCMSQYRFVCQRPATAAGAASPMQYNVQLENGLLPSVYNSDTADDDDDLPGNFPVQLPAEENSTACKCPDDWLLAGERCYRNVDEVGTLFYDDAKAVCSALNASLAMPKSSDQEAVVRAVAQGTLGGVWLGLSDRDVEGTFVYQDGTALSDLSYSNWASGAPSALLGRVFQDCVLQRQADGKWDDRSCYDLRGFVCEQAADCGDSATAPPTLSCPEGWTFYSEDNTCLLVSANRRRYAEATAVCAGAGGRLATPKTQAQNDRLSLLAGDKLAVWIGLTDVNTEGVWTWADGGTLIGNSFDFIAWGFAEPRNGFGRLDCAVLKPSTGQWAARMCRSPRYFACQRDAA